MLATGAQAVAPLRAAPSVTPTRTDGRPTRELREALAGLYDNAPSIRQIARDADLQLGRIAFEGGAGIIWQAVLDEATKSVRLDELVRFALLDYPSNPALRAAAANAGLGG